jgi:hypothetical protein
MEKIGLKLLSWIPQKHRVVSAYLLIFTLIIGCGIYFGVLSNPFKKQQEVVEMCSLVSISGKLLDQNNKELFPLGINIEGMNLNQDNTAQGIFTLKGARIPADSLISFQIKLADSTYFVKGFDLGNRIKYPINNCKIDVGIIRLNVKKISPIVTKAKKQGISKYSVNIKGDNKGKVIQGDKIIILNDN